MTKPGEEQPLLDVADLPNDIDHLMSLNPLALTPAAREAHLDSVIAYHRNLRVAKESGVMKGTSRRGRKDANQGSAPKIDLQALGIKPKPPVINRRF